jgi:curved DNA-binding protein CbpA
VVKASAPEDKFALLDEPCRPWLDAEAIEARFLALSAELHPDRVHQETTAKVAEANQRFIALNAAWQCLRDIKERLRHLLELEQGRPPDPLERLPETDASFYFELGQLCREVDGFLADRAQTKSPLLKVRFFQDGMEWVTHLQARLVRIDSRRAELESELQRLNSVWETAPPRGTVDRLKALPLDKLEQIYRQWSYLARWTAQLQERLVQLSNV